MEPVVTPIEMAAIDAEAPEPVDELIDRAAWAVAVNAIELLGRSPYGKRVAVLAGGGNNGEDGRRAVPHLQRRGAHCTMFPIGRASQADLATAGPVAAADAESRSISAVGRFDLIIDACFGTGLSRDFEPSSLPIAVGSTPVLAVDIPSGIDGLTGATRGGVIPAFRTVTFAAHKPGLLLGDGRGAAGQIVVADIGLDCSRATIELVGPGDVLAHWPRRSPAAHKWHRAVRVIGGSPGMTGAPALASAAALRAGAGYVVHSVPPRTGRPDHQDPDHQDLDHQDPDGSAPSAGPWSGPIEVVHREIPPGWGETTARELDRFRSAVLGPGMDPSQDRDVADFLAVAEIPTVVDAGALHGVAALTEDGRAPRRTHVLTPHDGEVARLAGHPPGQDRVAAARALAARLQAVVLLKGPTTVVADPDGRVMLSTAGDQRLATAGTGDVLSGIIGAGLAGGLDPLRAAAFGAELHGLAAGRSRPEGLVAGDLPVAVADLLSGAHRECWPGSVSDSGPAVP